MTAIAAEAHHELRWLLAGRRKRRRGPLPRQAQPDAIRLAYFGSIRGLLQHAKRLVDTRLVSQLPRLVKHGDSLHLDAPRDVSHIVTGVQGDFDQSVHDTQLEGLANRYFEETSRFQKAQLSKQLNAGLGVQVPVRDGPRIMQLNEHFAAENDAYIKSIPRRYFEQVEQRVLRGIGAGESVDDIAEALQDRYDVSESSAALIARDQVGKAMGHLNQIRQEDLGIDSFTWRDVGDNRVRETHIALNGRTYDWDEPPNEETGEPDADEGVVPGQPVSCRCSAEPVLDGLLASL